MKLHIVTAALILNLSSQTIQGQSKPVTMTVSGTNQNSGTGPGSNNEDNLAGNSTMGSYTLLQKYFYGAPPPFPINGCTFPVNVSGGTGVFRFADGNLLAVRILGGLGCADLQPGTYHYSIQYEIINGTGRFKGTSGGLTLKATVTQVSTSFIEPFSMLTGEIEGTIIGAKGL